MNPGKIQAFGALENYHCTRHWKNMESFGNFTEIQLNSCNSNLQGTENFVRIT